jgi:ribosomal protein S18 acetylase RimI-like enzyme
MTELDPKSTYTAAQITRELAKEYAADFALLASQIPQVEYTGEDILAEQKGNRFLLNKWQHSLVIVDNYKPIAFVMSYERLAEGNAQYPDDTLYISELSVVKTHQHKGIAYSLLKQFFEMNNSVGFQSLTGELNYSVQTNSAEWNKHVINLYEAFGFKQRATKEYPNRTDVVLGVGLDGLQLQ